MNRRPRKADSCGVGSTPTILYQGGVPGITPERPWTARFVAWIVAARSHRVICLVLGIWVFNAFDLALTILAHQQGVLQEENPLALHLLRQGPASIILFKIGLVLVGSYPLLRFRTARIAEMAACLILIAYAMLAVHWSTCYELYAHNITHQINMAGAVDITRSVPR